MQNRILPAVRAFNPDLILLSAGFDAGKNDVGNMNLVDELKPREFADNIDLFWINRTWIHFLSEMKAPIFRKHFVV